MDGVREPEVVVESGVGLVLDLSGSLLWLLLPFAHSFPHCLLLLLLLLTTSLLPLRADVVDLHLCHGLVIIQTNLKCGRATRLVKELVVGCPKQTS